MSKYTNPLCRELLDLGFELEDFKCKAGEDTFPASRCRESGFYRDCHYTSRVIMTPCWPGVFLKHGYDLEEEFREAYKADIMYPHYKPYAHRELRRRLGIKEIWPKEHMPRVGKE